MRRLGFSLEKEATGSRARAARFRTLHNEVLTPIFMPVATQASVKGQSFAALESSGSTILLANTYHLMLRPGEEVFRKLGGIHGFMNWKHSVLTDSGGFQIFSLPNSRIMTEAGARFRSYVDQREILLTPERSIEMQRAIGSDIMMVLDQCVPSVCDRAVATQAMRLTYRWAERSLAARGDSPQSLFAIVQGACFEDLRRESARVLTELPFDGFAIGGLAVGETRAQREDFTELTAALLPSRLPRYLMGVGMPIDLLEAVHRGVDMFDCILPGSLAQQGKCFSARGRLDLRKTRYKFDPAPIDPACGCGTCRTHARAYLHHLVKAEEPMAWQLIGSHNLHFYHQLMSEIRRSILEDRFMEYYRATREPIQLQDEETRKTPPKPRPRGPVLSLGEYEVQEGDGFASIRHAPSGEVMHSISNPMEEARRLYVEQSRLSERLTAESSQGEELVIWDVGLGAATNAMAAIACAEGLGARRQRRLRVVSFENDLSSLRLALRHPARFPHLKHAAPHVLAKEGGWRAESGIDWKLLEGDFLARIGGAPAPDLIFFDPFSYKTNPALWTAECFGEVFARCQDADAVLLTYSASTAVRAALLAAGFFVASGAPTGPKRETTLALTARAAARGEYALLGRGWLERWNRSGARTEATNAVILAHPQFR